MSSQRVPAELRFAVEQRAGGRCEYCLVPSGAVMWPHEADHIIAEQHGGKMDLNNLALACFHCNRRKGPNIASVDPHTQRIVPLFNPRINEWTQHFRIEAVEITPLTENGRATAELLRFNSAERLLVRRALRQAGRW
jgi:5-methylcytosine-specific restriction endonuclease McrA